MILLKRTAKRVDELNLIPLINIVFVLLIFFMVVGRIEGVDALAVRLPKTGISDQGYDETHAVMVYVKATGEMAVNHDLVAKEDLGVIIKTALLEDAHKPVRIKADAQLPASTLIWVMQTIEKAGAQYVSIITERGTS